MKRNIDQLLWKEIYVTVLLTVYACEECFRGSTNALLNCARTGTNDRVKLVRWSSVTSVLALIQMKISDIAQTF